MAVQLRLQPCEYSKHKPRSYRYPFYRVSRWSWIGEQVFPNGQLPARQASSGSGFYDTDGDNFLSPLDVLQVINQINLSTVRLNGGEGELARTTDSLFSTVTPYSDPDKWWIRAQSRAQNAVSRPLRK